MADTCQEGVPEVDQLLHLLLLRCQLLLDGLRGREGGGAREGRREGRGEGGRRDILHEQYHYTHQAWVSLATICTDTQHIGAVG